jgi:hypothetical protein
MTAVFALLIILGGGLLAGCIALLYVALFRGGAANRSDQ